MRKAVEYYTNWSKKYLCQKCKMKRKLKPFELPAAPQIPKFRLKALKAFQHTGVDMFGPYYVILRNFPRSRDEIGANQTTADKTMGVFIHMLRV
jgi:hypothetical protein